LTSCPASSSPDTSPRAKITFRSTGRSLVAIAAVTVCPWWPCRLGAHTSPLYVYLGTNDIFNMSDASYMLTLIQGGLDYVDNIALHRDGSERKAVVKSYLQQGVQALLRRMHELGLAH
jgi:hypothetical protein